MENLLRELYAYGFHIVPEGNEWVASTIRTEPIRSDTYEGAVKLAYAALQESKGVTTIQEFTAIVRYNRGLGIEYKNLPTIQAINLDEAKAIATINADKIVGGPGVDIREVRVKPKG